MKTLILLFNVALDNKMQRCKNRYAKLSVLGIFHHKRIYCQKDTAFGANDTAVDIITSIYNIVHCITEQ